MSNNSIFNQCIIHVINEYYKNIEHRSTVVFYFTFHGVKFAFRNIQVAYLIVDDMHADYPELIKV